MRADRRPASTGRRPHRLDRLLDIALLLALIAAGPAVLWLSAPREPRALASAPAPLPAEPRNQMAAIASPLPAEPDPAGQAAAFPPASPLAAGVGAAGPLSTSAPANPAGPGPTRMAAVEDYPADPDERGLRLVPPAPEQRQVVLVPTPASTPARPAALVPLSWPGVSVTPPWDPGPRVTVLLLGIDSRAQAGEIARSDTLIVATIDPRARTAAMLSIPRDLWVRIPDVASGRGAFEERINVAYALGERLGYPGGGAALARRTVEQNFGIRIDYTAVVDFVGFVRAIDALGGITVDVPRPLADNAYPTEDYGVKTIYFPPGRQRMDGNMALMYARARHADNDLERGRRQQLVLLAARDEALKVEALPRLASLIGVLREAIATDVPTVELLRLARVAPTIDRDSVVMRGFDAAMCTDQHTALGASILLPRWAAIEPVVRELFPGARGGVTPVGPSRERAS